MCLIYLDLYKAFDKVLRKRLTKTEQNQVVVGFKEIFALNVGLDWMLGAGALGRPRGMEWGGRREEGSGWGTHVYLWRIHFDIWQN